MNFLSIPVEPITPLPDRLSDVARSYGIRCSFRLGAFDKWNLEALRMGTLQRKVSQ